MYAALAAEDTTPFIFLRPPIWPVELKSRFGDKLLGIRVELSPKRDCGSERVNYVWTFIIYFEVENSITGFISPAGYVFLIVPTKESLKFLACLGCFLLVGPIPS